jgi:hypothetical protein
MWQQAQHFVNAVAGDIPPICTADEALKDIMLARDYLRLHRGV